MSDHTHPHTCKNCSHTFTGHYCNQCGVQVYHRITNHHLVHEVTHAFLHADKSVFNFLKNIVIRPGIMAREYIDGKRKVFNPVQFLVIAVGLIIWLMAASDYFKGLQQMQAEQISGIPKGFQQKMQAYNEWANHHTNLITFISMPLFALCSWLFFKKRGNNYAEHLMLIIFTMCQSDVFTILLLLAAILFHLQMAAIVTITFLIMATCFTLVYSQFYAIPWYKALWKTVLIYFLSIFGQMVVISIGLFIYMAFF